MAGELTVLGLMQRLALVQGGGGIVGASNFKYANTLSLTNALMDVINGIDDARIGIGGDSTGLGYTIPENGAYATSIAAYFSNYLAANGVPSNYSGRMGDGARGNTLAPVFDPRMAFPAAWGVLAGATVLGSQWFQNTTTEDQFTVTPNQPVNAGRLWYYRQSGFAQGQMQAGSGPVVAIDENLATSAIAALAFGTGLAADLSPLKINRLNSSTAGATFDIGGWEFWDNSKKQAIVSNIAMYGSSTVQWAANSQYRYPSSAIITMSYDAFWQNAGINDMTAGTAVAVAKANLQVNINAQRSIGKTMILQAPFPVSTATVAQSVQDQYEQMYRDLSAENDLPLIVPREIVGVWNASTWADDKHPKPPIYQAVAEAAAKAVLQVMNQGSGVYAGSAGFMAKVDSGQSATMVADSDSTGASTSRWIYKIAPYLAARRPLARVEYYAWNSGTNAYDLTVVQAGSSGQVIKIYNAAVVGTQTYYNMGGRFMTAFNVNADWFILNHGHNEDYNWPIGSEASISIAAVNQILTLNPNAGVSLVSQNPLQSSSNGTNRSIGRALAAALMGWDLINVFLLFNDQGKAAALYLDDVHPSITPGGGDDLIFNTLIVPRLASQAKPSAQMPFTIGTKKASAIANGDFQAFSGAVPDGWNAVNCTVSKDTTNFETGAWSAKITSTSASQPYLEQVITGAAAVALRGKYITVATRFRIPAANTQAVYVGDITTSNNNGSTFSTSVRGWGITSGNGRDGFLWGAITLLIPTDATDIKIRTPGFYTSSGMEVSVDRMSVVEGRFPYDLAA